MGKSAKPEEISAKLRKVEVALAAGRRLRLAGALETLAIVPSGSLAAARPDFAKMRRSPPSEFARLNQGAGRTPPRVCRDYAVARSFCKASRASSCWRMASCAALSIL